MQNYKIVFLICLTSLLSNSVFGQKGTQSPYSVFGLGELNNGEYAYFMGMGGALTANTDSTIVNQNNPASYAYISRHRPLFQIGLNGKFSTFTEGSNSTKQNQFGLNQFQLGFPIMKNWGGSFGLTPFSSTGYNITNSDLLPSSDSVQFIDEGAGTISKFHVGTAYKYKFGRNLLSAGVNANFLFGTSNKIESFEYVNYPGTIAFHSRVERKTRVKAFNFDMGLIFEHYFENSNSFSLGLKYSPAMRLKANQDLLAYSYSESYYDNFNYNFQYVDTTELIDNNAGFIYLPEAYNVGFEYRMRGKEDQSYLLKFSGDVKFQKWSTYYEDFNGTQTSPDFKDRLSTSFGMQLSPHVGRNSNNNAVPLLNKLHYRVGFNYTLSEIFLNNTQLTNYGISFGLGIPVTTGNSNTNLNLGLKYGSMGTTNSGLIKEDYLGVYFGVTISPGIYDRWFLKRKYD